jgi:hypothetical protein
LEIEHLKIGKEYHFDADEIIQRLEARETIWQEQQIKREEAEKAVQKTPKPKPKTKAKVK